MPLVYKTDTVAVYQSRLYQMNSTVVETSDLVLVTDPGYLPDEVSEIREYVDEIRGERPVYVLFTHSDYDHIAGYGAFAKEITLAGQAFDEHADKAWAVQEVIKYDDEFYIERQYEIVYPHIDVVCKLAEEIQIGYTTLTFYKARGHNSDGILTLIQPLGLLIAGDYLSDIEFPFVYDSFAEYKQTLHSLERLLSEYAVKLIIPGHGSVAQDRQEMNKRIHDSWHYLDLVELEALTGENGMFCDFFTEQGYRYKMCLDRRHQDNLQVFKKEVGIEGL